MSFYTNIWNILEKILLIIGPFLAAWGAIWLKDKFDRKHQFREWFYKHYIFEGLIPVLEYLSFIETPISRIGSILQETKIDKPQFPASSLAIIYELINSSGISMHFSQIVATYEELAYSQKQQLIAWSKGECVFRSKSATNSDSFRPPFPVQFGHLFRSKSAALKIEVASDAG